VTGKNVYTTEVDGDAREYIVHVPTGYDPNSATPAVLMLHGGGGSGEGMYSNSGWKEVGESQTILTIFPTALEYCYTNWLGQTRFATRWHSLNRSVFCVGQTLKDDVAFLRQLIAELKRNYNVDADRLYMVGFSSGGQMVSRCALEMSDLLTAVVQSGGSSIPDDVGGPPELLPVAFEVGSRDSRWVGVGNELPMADFEAAMAGDPFCEVVSDHVRTFDFEQTYAVSGDSTVALTALFKGVPDPGREFAFTLVKGLEHKYPNTANHPRYGAEENWRWLRQFRRR
jgi:polyhydroxybutyrate depolymerase